MSETKGIIIRPDKTVRETTLTCYQDYSQAVEGYIEAIALRDGSTMYCNEEYTYQFTSHDVNWIASDVAGLGGRLEFLVRPILGPVVVVGPVDEEGWDTDITDAARRWIKRVGNEAGAKYEK